MLTLYALTQSRAQRIAWLLELLQADYQVQMIERDKESKLAPAHLREIHPLGKSPIIQDNDVIIAESGAICEYLLAKFDTEQRLQITPEHADFWAYRQWVHYAEGSLMPLLVMSLIFRKIDEKPMPFFAKPIARKITDGVRTSFLSPQLALHLDYIEQSLTGKTWLVGDKITIADVMMSFPLQAIAKRANVDALPNIAAYVQRIESNEFYFKAEDKVGKLVIL